MQKQGMNANGGVPREVLDEFTNSSSWFWTYSLKPSGESVQWGIDNEKEFVPLINLKRVLPKEYGKCSFKGGTCTVDMITNVLRDTMKSLTVKYLMGYNEPYASHSESSGHGNKHLKGVNGSEGAYWWRMWVQPAAEQLNLTLVSPTTGISKQKVRWMVDFLKACYDAKDEPENPCKVDLIKVFSVHEYKCYERYWLKYAARDGGAGVEDTISGCPTQPGDFRFSQNEAKFKPKIEKNFFTNVKDTMRDHYGNQSYESFWLPYFDSVKLWVTETSCSGDYRWNKANREKGEHRVLPWVPPTPTSAQSCKAITGLDCDHGRGSLQAFLDLESIERFSWFTLFPNPKKTHPNYPSIVAGCVWNATTLKACPTGRALLNDLDSSTDCDTM